MFIVQKMGRESSPNSISFAAQTPRFDLFRSRFCSIRTATWTEMSSNTQEWSSYLFEFKFSLVKNILKIKIQFR